MELINLWRSRVTTLRYRPGRLRGESSQLHVTRSMRYKVDFLKVRLVNLLIPRSTMWHTQKTDTNNKTGWSLTSTSKNLISKTGPCDGRKCVGGLKLWQPRACRHNQHPPPRNPPLTKTSLTFLLIWTSGWRERMGGGGGGGWKGGRRR